MLQRVFSQEDEYLHHEQKLSHQQTYQQNPHKLRALQLPALVTSRIDASDFAGGSVDTGGAAAGVPGAAEFLNHGSSGAASLHGAHQSMLYQQAHNTQHQHSTAITTLNMGTSTTSSSATQNPPATATLARTMLASQQQPSQLPCDYAYTAASVEQLAVQHRLPYSPILNQPSEREVVDKNIAMWVGNIPVDATEQELFFYFAPSNPISIYLRPGSRCAFVNYRTYAEVDRAVELYNRSILRLCQIVCRKRRPSTKGPEQPQRVTAITNTVETVIGGPRYFLALCQDRAVFEVIQSEQKYIPTASAIIKLQAAIQLGTPVFVVFVTECDHCIRGIGRVIPPVREGLWNQKYIQLRMEKTGILPFHQVFDPAAAMTIERMLDGQEFGLDLASRVADAFRIMQIYNAGGSSTTVSPSSSFDKLPPTTYPGDTRLSDANSLQRVAPGASATRIDGGNFVHREHVPMLKAPAASAVAEKSQIGGASMEYHPLQSQSLFNLHHLLTSEVQRPSGTGTLLSAMTGQRPNGESGTITSLTASGTAKLRPHGTSVSPALGEGQPDGGTTASLAGLPEILFVPTARDASTEDGETPLGGNSNWELSKTRRAKLSRS